MAIPAPNGAGLPDPGDGGADHSGLCDLCLGRRTCADWPGSLTASGTSVCLLIHALVDDHAPRLRGGVHRSGDARRELVEGRADSNGTWHRALYHSVGHGRQSRHAAALGRSTGRFLSGGARGLGSDVTLVRSDRSAPTHTDDRALRGRAGGCILRPVVLTNLV